MSTMNKFKLIVGLGNYPEKYKYNRHNLGFIVLDRFIEINNLGKFEEKQNFKGEILKNNGCIFLKPLTYMNNSGISVLEVSKFFKISPEEILVIHDDIDLDFGKTKLSFNSSDAGHNGVKDIISKLGTQGFYRLRFGIGRPLDFTPVHDYVLSDFSIEEKKEIQNFKLQDYLI